MEYDIKIDLLLLFGHIHCCSLLLLESFIFISRAAVRSDRRRQFSGDRDNDNGGNCDENVSAVKYTIQAVLTILDTESCK